VNILEKQEDMDEEQLLGSARPHIEIPGLPNDHTVLLFYKGGCSKDYYQAIIEFDRSKYEWKNEDSCYPTSRLTIQGINVPKKI
jgi:hypothetical protein